MGCHNLSFLNVEFKPAFNPPLSFSSRGSSVPLGFLPSGGIICSISEVVDISPGNLDSSLYFIQPSTVH